MTHAKTAGLEAETSFCGIRRHVLDREGYELPWQGIAFDQMRDTLEPGSSLGLCWRDVSGGLWRIRSDELVRSRQGSDQTMRVHHRY